MAARADRRGWGVAAAPQLVRGPGPQSPRLQPNNLRPWMQIDDAGRIREFAEKPKGEELKRMQVRAVPLAGGMASPM